MTVCSVTCGFFHHVGDVLGVADDPGSAEKQIKKGYDSLETGKLDEAIRIFNKAIELDKKCERCFLRTKYSPSLNNEFDAAIRDATQALTLEPRKVEAWSIRAIAHAQGNLEEALKDGDRVCSIDTPKIRWRTPYGVRPSS